MTRFHHAVLAAVAAISICAVSACSGGHEGASEQDISNALAVQLDPGLEVREVEITATEALGSEVDPRFRTRSSVTVAYEEDFYRQTGEIDGRPLLTRVAAAGDTLTGDLITVSTPRGDNWRVQVQRVEFPPIQGRAESQFGNSRFVVEGSEEHQTLTAQLEEAEAQAEAERARKVAELSALLAGTWRSSQPVTRDGTVYQHRGLQTGYHLSLNAPDGMVGTGTAEMYVFSQPDDSVTTDVGYVIDPSGEFATLTFNSGAYHRQLRTNAGRNMEWRLTSDGRMTANVGRTEWAVQLRKQ